MKTVTIKVKGATEGLVTEIEVSSKNIADHIHSGLDGSPALEKEAECITQEFVDRHGIFAKYHSGTFLGFSIKNEDECDNEFKAFKRSLKSNSL